MTFLKKKNTSNPPNHSSNVRTPIHNTVRKTEHLKKNAYLSKCKQYTKKKTHKHKNSMLKKLDTCSASPPT